MLRSRYIPQPIKDGVHSIIAMHARSAILLLGTFRKHPLGLSIDPDDIPDCVKCGKNDLDARHFHLFLLVLRLGVDLCRPRRRPLAQFLY